MIHLSEGEARVAGVDESVGLTHHPGVFALSGDGSVLRVFLAPCIISSEGCRSSGLDPINDHWKRVLKVVA